MTGSDKKELRVILDNINVLNDEWFDTFPTDEGQTSIHDALEYEIIKADKILAKPPRNCDVGTAEEQADRFLRFCRASKLRVATCKGCLLANTNAALCEFAWAQTPYEAQEGGADGVQSTP